MPILACHACWHMFVYTLMWQPDGLWPSLTLEDFLQALICQRQIQLLADYWLIKPSFLDCYMPTYILQVAYLAAFQPAADSTQGLCSHWWNWWGSIIVSWNELNAHRNFWSAAIRFLGCQSCLSMSLSHVHTTRQTDTSNTRLWCERLRWLLYGCSAHR